MHNFIKTHATPIGMLCLAAGIILKRFGGDFIDSDFLIGLLIGISLPLNLLGLITNAKKKRENAVQS